MRAPDAEPAVALLVLAKPPRAGRVKTRLCPPATPEQAARIAAAALLDAIDAVCALPHARPVVALSGDLTGSEREPELTAALRDVSVIKQRGDSLGERIVAAHEDTAALHPDLPVLQIGMDTPQVDAAMLGAARGDDAVLGPASDGGWWLLGLRDPLAARVIADVPTSRPDTGTATAVALSRGGLRFGYLETLTDVDTVADARAVARVAPDTRFASAVLEVA